jgi:prolyl-tRNA editing enzyme YbaK/EbsC (Cys-tRNA(Pro) deacylase)
MAPWWWFLREPKRVGATVGILIVLIFPWFYNCVHHCGTVKSALLYLVFVFRVVCCQAVTLTSYQLHRLRNTILINWVVLSSGNVVTRKDGLDTQKALLVTPKTEPATQQAAVITQATQFVKMKGCSCDPHIPNPHVGLQCVGNCRGASGCDTGATSPSAQRSDQGLEPDAAAGRVLMNGVIYVASGRRQVLLVMELTSPCTAYQHAHL